MAQPRTPWVTEVKCGRGVRLRMGVSLQVHCCWIPSVFLPQLKASPVRLILSLRDAVIHSAGLGIPRDFWCLLPVVSSLVGADG